jgi:hypothetical protein
MNGTPLALYLDISTEAGGLSAEVACVSASEH